MGDGIMLLWTDGRLWNAVQFRQTQAFRHTMDHIGVLLNTPATANSPLRDPICLWLIE
jgi:hypothetical protein